MVKRLKYAWLQVVAAAVLGCCTAACVSDHYAYDFERCEAPYRVDLALSLQMPRSGEESRTTRAAADNLPAERIRDLRVVIVSLPETSRGERLIDTKPCVEVNELLHDVEFDRFGQRELLLRLVLTDRKKKIYLLANCEKDKNNYLAIRDAAGNANIDLSADAVYLPGSDGRAPIEEYTFTAPTGPYGATYAYGAAEDVIRDYCVPVTAVHELTIPTLAEVRAAAGQTTELVCRVESPLYMVRAVNKLDVTIENNTGSTIADDGTQTIQPTQVRLKSFSISKISTGKTHLFARLDEADALFDSYRPTAEELARPVYERSDLNPAWMRWLKAEAQKSQDDSYAPYYQWLTAYWLPAGVAHAAMPEQRFTEAVSGWLESTRQAERQLPSEWSAPTVYFPESRYIPADDPEAANEGAAAAEAPEQAYVLTYEFEQRTSGGQLSTIRREAVLPNLKSLFRNTHVKIRLSITDKADVQLTLVVLPWTLAPEEEWNYHHTVNIAENGFLAWQRDEAGNATFEDDNQRDCRLVLRTDGTAAVGKFTIASPVNDLWYAYLIPLTGNPDAFMFVDEKGVEIAGDPCGLINGTDPATIRIRHRYDTTSEQNTAKLQIMVRTADNRFLEADVCKGEATYYTIIQNRNHF